MQNDSKNWSILIIVLRYPLINRPYSSVGTALYLYHRLCSSHPKEYQKYLENRKLHFMVGFALDLLWISSGLALDLLSGGGPYWIWARIGFG